MMLRKIAISAWGLICLIVALDAFVQVFVTYAPGPDLSSECQAAELRGIARLRRYWEFSLLSSSGLLASNTAALIILAWPRRGPTIQAAKSDKAEVT
jgi:hypothetical protein